MWDLIILVPDQCLSIYFIEHVNAECRMQE